MKRLVDVDYFMRLFLFQGVFYNVLYVIEMFIFGLQVFILYGGISVYNVK